jgi:hypothetical protein
METTISTKALQVIKAVKEATAKSITGVSFVSVKNYTNKAGEVSNNLINIGINYANAKKKDIATLNELNIDKAIKEHGFKCSKELLEEARKELMVSFIKPDENRSQGQINAYTIIFDGVKVHNHTGVLYLYGYREKKDVLVKGEYKAVNSKPLTIAKDELRKLLKTNKFVNFALEVGNTLKLNGETLEL